MRATIETEFELAEVFVEMLGRDVNMGGANGALNHRPEAFD